MFKSLLQNVQILAAKISIIFETEKRKEGNLVDFILSLYE